MKGKVMFKMYKKMKTLKFIFPSKAIAERNDVKLYF